MGILLSHLAAVI